LQVHGCVWEREAMRRLVFLVTSNESLARLDMRMNSTAPMHEHAAQDEQLYTAANVLERLQGRSTSAEHAARKLVSVAVAGLPPGKLKEHAADRVCALRLAASLQSLTVTCPEVVPADPATAASSKVRSNVSAKCPATTGALGC
jgi:hypothetical protein